MKYPETSPRPVVDEYYSVKAEDPYRWLEDAKDPTVRDWTEAQNRLMREFLDAVPQRPWPDFCHQAPAAPSTAHVGNPIIS